MMQQTNQSFTALHESVMIHSKETMTSGNRLISKYAGNSALRQQDISIALQEYTPEEGYRIRFVLRNRQKTFWTYATKQDRDKELKRIYFELSD